VTVEKLHQTLRNTFLDKDDWQNVLVNLNQIQKTKTKEKTRQNEKIRPNSVRLKVAKRKCCFTGANLARMCEFPNTRE
jgi:hypothetical protein